MSESTSPDVVLQLDVRAERDVARLRLAGAIVCALGAAAIASLGPTWIGWVVVVLASLASVGWTVAFVRARRRRGVSTTYSLALRTNTLELSEAGRVVSVPWVEVRAAEVDEDRLVVLVHRHGTEAPLVLEPRYEGLSVYALCDLVVNRLSPPTTQTPSQT